MISCYPIGDGCLCWSFGETIDEELVRKTLFIYKKFKKMDLLEKWGIHDIVPSYKSIAFHFAPSKEGLEKMERELDSAIRDYWTRLEQEKTIPSLEGKKIIFPVVYDGEDLKDVARHCRMSKEEVIRLHCEGRYMVAMVGFKPYFPYLLGLNPLLETPRLETPRTRIPAGAVAIGGGQTGVYPEESPGGWNLIGRTDPELLKQVEPGDIIIMKNVENLNED
ncbi:allophanate hydrolase subunit 1 [Oceanispirochaeta crateris]|uniref:Allophanate hydrolase subunit 1 n=1 Tax=Oceanispirochaeta crateris TaxID=2518645 RepID=A0A5C1QGX7_9SPIO|nr:allophanate hydrolase subunit 1 [Oceanispirochaeta crateris]QEN06568.1 allophanate hydrolase subunit 1 [Oceanispirochaeta crateris]